MGFFELVFTAIGASVVFCYVLKTLRLLKVLFPKLWDTLPGNFFTSMGEWAGESDVCLI